MIEAFITKHEGIYPFKHIAYVYPGNSSTILYIRTVTSTSSMEITFTSVEDKNRQLHNFMQYLTKPEPTTTKLS